MSDIQHIQNKADVVTSIIASAGIPAPLFVWWLDEAGKFVAIIYSVLGAIYMAKQLLGRKHDNRE